MLQTLKVKFNQAEVDPTCPICKLETEDLQHLLTSCPAYRNSRKSHFQNIKEYKFSVDFSSQSDLSLLDQKDEIAVRTLFFHSILL
jgi:hypothetical protein